MIGRGATTGVARELGRVAEPDSMLPEPADARIVWGRQPSMTALAFSNVEKILALSGLTRGFELKLTPYSRMGCPP
jgi:hypothetical protein